MDELTAVADLAETLGVQTRFTDGLGNAVHVGVETLLRVCSALGYPVAGPDDAVEALESLRRARETVGLPPVLVAWEGVLPPVPDDVVGSREATLLGEDGRLFPLQSKEHGLGTADPLPLGYHTLRLDGSDGTVVCTVISTPREGWRRPGELRSWGVGTHLAALRGTRSRSVGDLRDLEEVCRWVGTLGGDLVTVLPLLPTFNDDPAEPSPYAPVSRLFWSELILDLGETHRPTGPVSKLNVRAADREVREALAGYPAPERSGLGEELLHYARFRGAQARLGRNWRDWPTEARDGSLAPQHVDPDEEFFHLVAQSLAGSQLDGLRDRMDRVGLRLGLDLAVGVHPDGYDVWARQDLFTPGVSVGAPPDPGFPSGQDWGFPPVNPRASQREGHRYLARSIAHQAALAGVLRIDHVMAFTRLYWIPEGCGLHQGTYVSYPAEELFAVLTLESHRNRCEIVGENLGTVPDEIRDALPRHRIWGMYVAQFQAAGDQDVEEPDGTEIAMFGTHDTPTLVGWLQGLDIDERVRCGLLPESEAAAARENRRLAVRAFLQHLQGSEEDPGGLLESLLEWLGRSDSPLVVTWIEDLWLEDQPVNVPGTRSSDRPNWQRPMGKLLDEVIGNPAIERLLNLLNQDRIGPTARSS
jgi:4-alpha-glucanotransferase